MERIDPNSGDREEDAGKHAGGNHWVNEGPGSGEVSVQLANDLELGTKACA